MADTKACQGVYLRVKQTCFLFYKLYMILYHLLYIPCTMGCSWGTHESWIFCLSVVAWRLDITRLRFGIRQKQRDLEVLGAYNWLHNCSYNPLRRPLSRVSQVMIGLYID